MFYAARMQEFADGGVALVAGGSGGLGRAVCVRLAAAGIRVALTYRHNAGAAEETAAACRAAGGQASIVAADLQDAALVAKVVDGLCAEHGPLQTVVHAVGSDIPMRYVSQVDVETWQRVLHADVDGFFHLVRASLPHLRKARGSIVALTSAGLK